MLAVLAATAILVLLAVGVHYEALRAVSRLVPRIPGLPRFHVAVSVLGALVAHLIEVLIFSAGLLILLRAGLGELPGAESGVSDVVYFSLVAYTSLGFGDIVPEGPLRILAGVEALTGLVLIAWTSSFTYYAMRRFWYGS